MKKILLMLFAGLSSYCVYAQSVTVPTLDTSLLDAGELEALRSDNIKKELSAIAFIDADGEKGQGIFLDKDLLLTSYSLVANKNSVRYYVQGDPVERSIAGYVVADEAHGLILLKTADIHDNSIVSPYYSSQMLPPAITSDLVVYYLSRQNTDTYQIGRASVPKPEYPGVRRFEHYHLVPMDYKGADPVNSCVILSLYGTTRGLMVYKEGKPFLANALLMQSLLFHKGLDVKRTGDLPLAYAKQKKSSKSTLYKAAVSYDRMINGRKGVYDRTTLNYIKRGHSSLSLYFTHTPLNVYRSRLFNPNLQMIDLETGMIYRPEERETDDSHRVYTGTSYFTSFHFANVPPSVNRVMFFNIPEKVWDYMKEVGYNRPDYFNPFFSTLLLNNFSGIKKADYDLDENRADEGTIAFYLLKNSNARGNAKVYVNGKEAGSLDRYYNNPQNEGYCGLDAAITLRLKAGEYKYKAVAGNKAVIERKFRVEAGKCTSIQVKF